MGEGRRKRGRKRFREFCHTIEQATAQARCIAEIWVVAPGLERAAVSGRLWAVVRAWQMATAG